jgi:hypothetical protein
MKTLPNIGDILMVHGISEFKARVAIVTWSPKDSDYLISLDWDKYGSSRVWARDENKIWYRLSINN